MKRADLAKKYGIPDGAWRAQFVFDRIGIWQVDDDDGAETFKGSVLYKPETKKAKDRDTAPRGILVSAGAAAMDALHTNGIEVGDMVWVVRLSPWRRVVDVVDGKEKSLLVMRVGDIIGSESLAERLGRGAKYMWNGKEHVFCGEDGVVLERILPHQSEDY